MLQVKYVLKRTYNDHEKRGAAEPSTGESSATPRLQLSDEY